MGGLGVVVENVAGRLYVEGQWSLGKASSLASTHAQVSFHGLLGLALFSTYPKLSFHSKERVWGKSCLLPAFPLTQVGWALQTDVTAHL